MRGPATRKIGGSSTPRSRGHRGGVISMHRALAHFRLGPMNLVTAVCLCLFFTSIWVVFLHKVCRFWNSLLAWAVSQLPLHARLGTAQYRLGLLRFQIPYLQVQPVLPGPLLWSVTGIFSALLLGASFLFPKRIMPVTYLLRAAVLLQASALLYFAVWPLRFPHTPDSYMEGLISAGAGLISVVPLLFGFTYYIFDFGLWKKALLTALTMAHLALFLPFQVLLQALLLQKSVLFMPLLYIVFGIPIDVLMIIAFYSWGMTWSFREMAEV
jgi:hypothetical protein